MRTAIRRIIAPVLAAACLLSFSFSPSYAFWQSVAGSAARAHLSVKIGGIGSTHSLIDKLPPNTPIDVRDKLEQLLLTESEYVVNELINAVISIVDTPMYQGEIHVGIDIHDLFSGNAKPIQAGAILIYAEQGQYNIIHVRGDTWRDITSVDVLLAALSDPWSLVNMVSSVWIKGNLYTPVHAPVMHEGKYYLLYHFGESGLPPSQSSAWFELPEQFEYNESNAGGNGYITGMLVEYNGEYFYCKSTGGDAQPSAVNSWKWDVIPVHQAGFYQAGARVHTVEDGQARFWLSLRGTDASPSEITTRAGDWQELKKGWIGSQSDLSIKPFYFEHNTYLSGEVVIYGISPKMHYQYFRAVADVPSDQPPIIRVEGVNVVNEQYWESVYYEGHL